MKKYKVWFLLIMCNLFWAGNYIFGSFVVKEISPLWVTLLRWLLGIFILYPIAYRVEKPKLKTIKQSLGPLAIMGFLGIVTYNQTLYAALNYTSTTNTALINALNPGTILLFSVLLLREKVSKMQILGIAISFVAVLVVLTGGNLEQIFMMEYNKGDILMLFAIIVWSLYSIVARYVSRTVPPITATSVSATIAIIILAPFALRQGININNISPLTIIGVLYIVIFASVGSFVFWNTAIKEIGASRAGVFMNLGPVFTALINLFLGIRVTGAQVVGGIFVFLGVYLTTGMLEEKLQKLARASS